MGEICPACGKEYIGYPAVSRVDGETLICSDCGVREALETIGLNEKEQDNVLEMIHKAEAEIKAGE